MQIAICNALALMCWQSLRLLQDFSSRDFTWLCIGALLAGVGMWVVARRRRRWF
jgi:NO-binding membrane sensor protein with MHYT domain